MPDKTALKPSSLVAMLGLLSYRGRVAGQLVGWNYEKYRFSVILLFYVVRIVTLLCMVSGDNFPGLQVRIQDIYIQSGKPKIHFT